MADRRIRVNAVSPGPVDTPGIDGLAPDDEGARELKRALASGVLFGRMGQPEEIANAVLFLASPESSFINGTEIFVDGEQLKRVLVVLIPAIVYVLAVEFIGIYIASAVYIAGFMIWLGKFNPVKSIVAAVIVGTDNDSNAPPASAG